MQNVEEIGIRNPDIYNAKFNCGEFTGTQTRLLEIQIWKSAALTTVPLRKEKIYSPSIYEITNGILHAL